MSVYSLSGTLHALKYHNPNRNPDRYKYPGVNDYTIFVVYHFLSIIPCHQGLVKAYDLS